jgi:RNA polymerase sigma factor (sigma-70 family)
VAKPATELEDLGPPDDAPAALSRRRAGQPSTARARLGLSVGGVVFTIGALIQILAAAWFGLLMVLFGGSAEVLVHTGGLEPRTFATCSVVAIVLDAALLLAIATRSARRALRQPSPHTAPFTARHPFASASGGLVMALAFVLLCGWRPSPYFPYPLATVIVLASAYWFGLVGVFVIVRVAVVVWRPLKTWASTTEWRAGFLTASLLLAGGGGYWLLTTQWYAAPLHAIQARLEIDDPDLDTSVLARELDELCLAAGELEPVLAQSSNAPACAFLDKGTRWMDRCFSGLMKEQVPQAKQRLRNSRLNDYDLEDALMKALLATCTREPPPNDVAAYFFVVARNQIRRMAQGMQRTVLCDQLDEFAAPCSASQPPEIREIKLARLWDEAFCKLDPDKAELVRRRLEQDESFREIGEHLGIPETQAKDGFHNAMKKLRTKALNSCDID